MEHGPLPKYKGPQLAPFSFKDPANPAITISRYLGAGLHSHVFEAELDGVKYALKLFRFCNPKELAYPDQLEYGLVTPEEVANQCDPFNCECRAYGRLKEVGREDLAVKCYGYIYLDAEQEARLAEGGTEDWQRGPEHKDQPIRGIVKELLDDKSKPFTPRHFSRMRRDILDLNSLGIIVWDIREGNYINGTLIDFSQAIVQPHIELDWNTTVFSRRRIEECCTRDMICFDHMMTDWNESSPKTLYWRFFFPSQKSGVLRKIPQNLSQVWKLEGARFDAAFYDWRNPGQAKSRSRSIKGGGRGRGRVDKPQKSTRRKKRSR